MESQCAAIIPATLGDNDDALLLRMQGILGELSSCNLDHMCQQLEKSGMESGELVDTLVKEVYEQAVTQQSLVKACADLCILLEAWPHKQANVRGENGSTTSFRWLLINQCQREFKMLFNVTQDMATLSDEAKSFQKMHMLGNMKFIGHLVIRKMLTVEVGFQVIEELLKLSSEDALEALCSFLHIVGPVFDKKVIKQRGSLNATFDKIEELSDDFFLSQSTRFLLKDVSHLRLVKWSQKMLQVLRRNDPMAWFPELRALTVTMISGKSECFGVDEDTRLRTLRSEVEESFRKPIGSAQLSLGTHKFTKEDMESTLGELGVRQMGRKLNCVFIERHGIQFYH